MKILYISHNSRFNGGANRCLYYLIEEMLKKDVECHVLVREKEGEFLEALREKKIKIIYRKYNYWLKREEFKNIYEKLKWNYIQIRNIIQSIYLFWYVKKNKIDIIHSSSSVINIGAIAHKYFKVNHIWQFKEFGLEDHDYKYIGKDKNYYQMIEKGANKIIFISNALKDKFIKKCNGISYKIIYVGISKNYINPKVSFSSSKEIINILMSSTIYPKKGQMEIIEAAKILFDSGYKNFNIKLAGLKGSEEYFDMINKKIKEYGLEKNVEYIGFIDNLNNIRRDMDIEIVCSENEAFGRVSVEAMMSMMPVIASNTGANKEIVEDGVEGLIYRKGDTKDLANKIAFFLNNKKEIEKFGKKGFKKAIEKFSSEKNGDEIYRLYKEVIFDS